MSTENLLNRKVVSKAIVDKLVLSPGDIREVSVRGLFFYCKDVKFDRTVELFPIFARWKVINLEDTLCFTLTWRQGRRVEKIWKQLKLEKQNEQLIAGRKALLTAIGYQDVK